MTKPILAFTKVVKDYGTTRIVNEISFSVARGEFFTLLGPSGCGKTTTLRLLAGLEEPDSGEIELDGQCLAAPARGVLVPPDKRGIGMMFQSYAIWPHLSVFENVAFPLRVRNVSAAEIRRRVIEVVEIVGLQGLEERGATQLSGGQQQRVALARAIVHTPKVLLLDEPLSNLDVKLREQMRLELSALQKRLNLAVVYVTHDQDEALAMSDRIAVLNKGQVEQVGSPSELYEHPRTRFVSDFLGRTIVVSGTVRRDGADGFVVVRDSGSLSLPEGRGHEFSQGQEVRVLCRPEDITVLPATACGPNQVTGQVGRVAYMGSHLEYTISTAGSCLQVPAGKRDLYAVGATVRLQFDPASITVLAQ